MLILTHIAAFVVGVATLLYVCLRIDRKEQFMAKVHSPVHQWKGDECDPEWLAIHIAQTTLSARAGGRA